MDYISAKEAAEKWELGLRRVQVYCKEGRIPGAKKQGNCWFMPVGTEKPLDPRRAAERSPEAGGMVLHVSAVYPRKDPDRAALLLGAPYGDLTAASLAGYRGDYEPAKECWRRVRPGDPTLPTAALAASSAAISSGDYKLYHEIQGVLNEQIRRTEDERVRAILSMPQVLAAVNMTLPVMTPEWLKNADFSLFSPELKPFLLYLYALHLRNVGDLRSARAVARATLVLIEKEDSFTWPEIYFYLICAGVSYYLEEPDQAREDLAAALEIGAPYGLIAPYAEWLTGFGGMLESMLSQKYPHLLKPVTTMWSRVNGNWMNFRNQFTHENIATILTPQEHHAALLYARGMTYRQAAKMLSLSESRVRTIFSEVYQKLSVKDKNELRKCILTY